MSGYSTLYIVPKEEFLRYKGVKRGTTLPAVKTLKVQQLNFNEAENITNKVGCESGGKKNGGKKKKQNESLPSENYSSSVGSEPRGNWRTSTLAGNENNLPRPFDLSSTISTIEPMEQDQSDLGNDDQELTRQNLREAARRIDDENEQVEAENYLLHRRVNVAGQENIHPNASTIYYPPEGGANTSVREASEEIAAAAAGREGGNNTVAESFAPNESESGIWTSRIEEIPAEEAQPIILPTPTPALLAPSVHMDSIDTTQSTNTTQQSIQNDDSVPMDYDIENVPPQIHEFLNNPNHPPPMENEIEIPSRL